MTSEPRTDTRARIQEVALELFAKQGYEKTSLREISERIGVTKAALYYHFKTKEDIAASVFEDGLKAMEEMLVWARTKPRTREARAEILRRYCAVVRDGIGRSRFIQQTDQQSMPGMERFFAVMYELNALLQPENASTREAMQTGLAIHSLHFGWMKMRALSGGDLTEDEFEETLMGIVLDILP
ncbi:MAG: TetR/AcrR family transcriptional regulator [Corynebacteriales bacterium]|nr:TetR/AcrR family transcriptional regulator [Mycobacteriales bacterium]